MLEPLQLIIVEESAAHAELILRMLRDGGFEVQTRIVEDLARLREALAAQLPQVVISGFHLPGFSALAALEVVRQIAFDLPFIVVTQDANQEEAVDCLVAGADDLLWRDRVGGLAPSVRRAMQRYELLLAKQATENELRRREIQLRAAQHIARLGHWEADLTLAALEPNNELSGSEAISNMRWSDEVYRIFGYEVGQITPSAANVLAVTHPDDRELIEAAHRHLVETGTEMRVVHRILRPSGEERVVSVRALLHFSDDRKEARLLGVAQDITELHRASEVANRFATLIEYTPDAVVISDLEGRTQYLNPAGCRLFGFERVEEAMHQLGSTCVAEEDRGTVMNDVIPLLAQGGFWRGEILAQTFNAQERIPTNITAFPLIDSRTGRPQYIAAVVRDLRQEKAAQEEQRRLKVLLEREREILKLTVSPRPLSECLAAVARDVASSLPGAASAIFVRENHSLTLHSAGLDPEVAQSLSELRTNQRPHPETIPLDSPALANNPERAATQAQLAAAGFGFWRTAPILSANEQLLGSIELLTVGDGALGIEGQLLEWGVNLARVAIDRKRAERATQESEARYRTLVERTPLGIFIARNGRFLFVNDAIVQMFGCTENLELVGKSVRSFLDESIYPLGGSWLCEITEGHFSVTSCEEPLRLISGEAIDVEIMSIECLYEGQLAVQVILRDIGDRKRSEEEARERQAQLAHAMRLNTVGQMVAELAHEVNQPLYAIANYASACLDLAADQSTPLPSEMEVWIQHISEQAQRAGEIVRRVAHFVRKEPSQWKPVMLNALLWDTLALMEIDARVHEVRLLANLAEPTPAVYADAIQLEQVVVNLVLNATQAMAQLPPEQRQVTLATTLLGDRVRVAICDVGPGVPPEMMGRLFESFFTTKPDGMGLGLAISRSIIAAHGGQLIAQRNPDRGMTFSFELPISRRGALP